MPTTTGQAREDQVVDLVCEQLSDFTLTLRVVDRPDSDSDSDSDSDTDPGTDAATDPVDAFIEVEAGGTGEVWAACVSTITYAPREVSTEQYVRDDLPERLDPLARERGYAVRVDCVLPDLASDEESRRWAADYVERVTEAVRNALALGPGTQPLNGEGSIHVSGAARFPDGSRVVVTTSASSTADVTDQVRRSLDPAVRPELDRLAAARERGAPTLLILDQAWDERSPVVPIPTSFTLGPLGEERAGTPLPDAAVLVRPDGSVQPVHGAVGVRPA
ncbi:hypothetical protein [Saccharothrix sp. Mg75]|uniref:hypothetical protein n=1 Tax=Saccharothrix sp. Mg75 TaxID=3445357 RepID=UPI003EE93C4B